jgi:hypothetical protein
MRLTDVGMNPTGDDRSDLLVKVAQARREAPLAE